MSRPARLQDSSTEVTRPRPAGVAWSARGMVLVLVLVSVTALGGCSLWSKGTTVNGRLTAAADLNPSVSGRPSPLVLRIYELRSSAAFNQADFMALYQGDQAALAGDLVAREEITLQPGESRPLKRPLAADTRFIGVVGLFRDLEHARWRAVAGVVPGKSQALQIRVDALAVTIGSKP